jgi:hypothetical protein
MTPFTPHDLWRTAAALARQAGVRRDTVTALLNHTRGDATAIYDQHEMLSEKREAVDANASRVQAIIIAARDQSGGFTLKPLLPHITREPNRCGPGFTGAGTFLIHDCKVLGGLEQVHTPRFVSMGHGCVMPLL